MFRAGFVKAHLPEVTQVRIIKLRKSSVWHKKEVFLQSTPGNGVFAFYDTVIQPCRVVHLVQNSDLCPDGHRTLKPRHRTIPRKTNDLGSRGNIHSVSHM